MDARRFHEIAESGGTIALPGRTVLRIDGPDRTRFLNGQLSNDVTAATAGGAAVYACALDAKGHLEADLWLRELGEAYLIDAAPELQGTLQERLERYLIADDVTIEDLTGSWQLVHVLGELPGGSEPGAAAAGSADRFGQPGHDLWFDGTSPIPAATVSPAEAEVLRIVAGIPAWGAELTPGMLPPEAGIENRAISYEKGCYTGQEVISRMRRAGKTNRSLRGLVCPDPTVAPERLQGAAITDSAGKQVGAVTSVCRHPLLDRSAGLGYVSRVGQESPCFQLVPEDGGPALPLELGSPPPRNPESTANE